MSNILEGWWRCCVGGDGILRIKYVPREILIKQFCVIGNESTNLDMLWLSIAFIFSHFDAGVSSQTEIIDSLMSTRLVSMRYLVRICNRADAICANRSISSKITSNNYISLVHSRKRRVFLCIKQAAQRKPMAVLVLVYVLASCILMKTEIKNCR